MQSLRPTRHEQFNVQKNGGYELEHNYGHGRENLSTVVYLLNLLAYVTHRILEFGDRLYRECRQRASLRELWNDLRSLMKTLLLASWEEMLLVNLDRESGGPWKGTAQAGAKGERSVSHQQRDKAPIEVSRIRGKGR